MTEFDEKLNIAMHKYKMREGKKTKEIADDIGVTPQALYNFQNGRSSLNAENTKKLMDYLNISVDFKPKQD